MNVGHDAATRPAVLMLMAQNNQGKANVTVDKKFTGLYDLQTKLAPVTLDFSQVVSTTNSSSISEWHYQGDSNSTSWALGWVGTGARPPDWNPMTNGQVTVLSSLSPVKLQIVP